ncbi:hypothetical protein D9M70_477710 [compost metagenome]
MGALAGGHGAKAAARLGIDDGDSIVRVLAAALVRDIDLAAVNGGHHLDRRAADIDLADHRASGRVDDAKLIRCAERHERQATVGGKSHLDRALAHWNLRSLLERGDVDQRYVVALHIGYVERSAIRAQTQPVGIAPSRNARQFDSLFEVEYPYPVGGGIGHESPQPSGVGDHMSRVIACRHAELWPVQRAGTEYQQLPSGLVTARMPGMSGHANDQKQAAVGRYLHVVRCDWQGNRVYLASCEIHLADGGGPFVGRVDVASRVCHGQPQMGGQGYSQGQRGKPLSFHHGE